MPPEDAQAVSAASEPVVLRAGAAAVTVDPAAGGRLRSVVVAGNELLGTVIAEQPFAGCFAMAPYAGRVRHGRLTWRGSEVQLPRRLGAHAIHGLCYDRPWSVLERDGSGAALRCDLDPAVWPWRGWAVERFALEEGALTSVLEVHTAEVEMPAWSGWHPAFRRRVAGADVELEWTAAGMLRRDQEGIPTGAVVDVPDGPLDDAMTGFRWPAVLRWPGVLTLRLSADTDVGVVFTERSEVVCVEPQTAPPDAAALGQARVVRRDAPLRVTMRWEWTPEG